MNNIKLDKYRIIYLMFFITIILLFLYLFNIKNKQIERFTNKNE